MLWLSPRCARGIRHVFAAVQGTSLLTFYFYVHSVPFLFVQQRWKAFVMKMLGKNIINKWTCEGRQSVFVQMPLWIISAEWKYWGNLLHPADWCVRTDACCNCLHWFPRLLHYATRTRLQRHRTTQNYRLRTIEGQQQNNKIGIIVKKQKSFFGNTLFR